MNTPGPMVPKSKDAGYIAEQVSVALLLLLSFWVICYRLDAVPMYLWDESRQANNALEMLESGNLWYTTYDGIPDFWNTKPHLLVLLQWICMKLLGPGLLALRLPSAVAGCILILAGFRYLHKRSGFTTGAAWVAVMLGCGGFNTYHVTRTGDYDAILTLFIFLATLSWLIFLENPNRGKSLTAMAVWFSLALLTKGVAAAMWLPVWFTMGYAIKPRAVLDYKRIIVLFLIPTSVVMGYYGMREWLTPGYWQAVAENEFSGRYLRPNEGHHTSWFYYADVIWREYFMGFIIMLAFAGFVIKKDTHTKMYLRILLGILVFVVIISFSATRIYWYLAPAIPLMAFLVILPMAEHNNPVFHWNWSLFIAGIMVLGYYKNYRHNTYTEGVSAAKVLHQAAQSGRLPFLAKWHVGAYYPIEKYYAAVLKNKGLALKIGKDYQYDSYDTVIVSSMAHLDSLNRRYFMRQHHYPTDEMPVWVMVVDSARRH
ncbi:MAG: ArnT family glycosyltransferase [Sphingomonadales bacterium]|jgi:4-amino-4-deoxy-L-arabinose transferase-like glycosyltransferase